MKKLKQVIAVASVLVFLICLYSFMIGNKIFEGKFENEAFAWYFLAKGIFCSLALYLIVLVLEKLPHK